MDLIALGVLFAIIAACLIGIGNAWERNIRDNEPNKSRRHCPLDVRDEE